VQGRITGPAESGATGEATPRRLRASSHHGPPTFCRHWYGSSDGLLGSEAERFGVSPAVVLGEHLAEPAWPVGDGAVADLATRYWKPGNGHREAAGT
jgi:hypothetical protein